MAVHPETAPYLDAFRARDGGAEPRWLAERRAAAIERFAALGFPTRREEAWRFNDLRPLQRGFAPGRGAARGTADDIAPWRLAGAAHRLVLVDGRFDAGLSDLGDVPAGTWLASTARTLAERPQLVETALDAADEAGRQPFAALNAALFADGFVLALEPGVALARPVEIIRLSRVAAPASFHTRNAIVLGAGSSARVVETSCGSGAYWSNAVTAVRLGAGATLAHAQLQDEGAEAIHLALTRAALAQDARYDAFALALGARLARQEILARFDGEGGACGIDGAFLVRGEQEATIATFVDHAAPGCTTRELVKGVAEDRAHGVFLGRIAVRPEGQKTDAQQMSRNLLLSRRAAIDTKPELEILADDVKCSHGATVGDLDADALFYLRARGIAEADARRLLVEAFAAETLDRVADRSIRDLLATHLGRWLAAGGAA